MTKKKIRVGTVPIKTPHCPIAARPWVKNIHMQAALTTKKIMTAAILKVFLEHRYS